MRELLTGLAQTACGRSAGLARIPATFGHLVLGLVALLAATLLPIAFRPQSATGPQAQIAWALGGYVCTVLVPLAIAWVLARIWGHGPALRRYAVAFLWVWVVITLVLSVLPAVLGTVASIGKQASGAGDPPFTLGFGFFHFLGLVYVIWINFVLVRDGLGIGAKRAIFALALIAIVPIFLDGMRYVAMDSPMIVTTFKN